MTPLTQSTQSRGTPNSKTIAGYGRKNFALQKMH